MVFVALRMTGFRIYLNNREQFVQFHGVSVKYGPDICGWRMRTGKYGWGKCGWENADRKVRMEKSIKKIRQKKIIKIIIKTKFKEETKYNLYSR